jgi:hypothetical protein
VGDRGLDASVAASVLMENQIQRPDTATPYALTYSKRTLRIDRDVKKFLDPAVAALNFYVFAFVSLASEIGVVILFWTADGS